MFRLSALRLRLEHETQAYAIIDSPLIMAVDQEMDPWDFPLGPVVKNPLSNAVILEPPKIKSVTVSIVSPSICCEVWDWMP